MRAPISLRVRDGFTDRLVTRYASGFRFRKTANGGHADASVTLNTPANMFSDLGPNDRLWAYDKRTGRCLFDGYTNNPGAQTGRTGEGFDLSALGGSSRAFERAERLLYMDRAFSWWQRGGNTAALASATAEAGTAPDTGNPALLMQFQPGVPIDTGSFVQLIYDARSFNGKIGGYRGVFKGGVNDTNYQYRYGVEGGATVNWSLSVAGASSARQSVVDYTPGPGFVVIRLVRAAGGATTVALDNVWVALEDVVVLGQLLDRNGAYVQSASYASILASAVVEDLLGRVLNFCDPNASTVAATSFGIDQLTFLDAATPAEVFDQLALFEPDFLWEINETTASGLHVFNYRKWPTSPRYQVPASMPVERPGGDVDLCNRIAVNWTDAKGNAQVTVRGAYVPTLGDRNPVLSSGAVDPAFVGRIRDAESVTLPDGKGSLANAQRIGDQVLATKAAPPRAATVRVDRPIMDRDRGEKVQPWEIVPGYVVQVCATGELMRLTEVEYDDEDGVATLTLGEPMLTIEQRVARLRKAVK